MQNPKKVENLKGHLSNEELEERERQEGAFRREKVEIRMPESLSNDITGQQVWSQTLNDADTFGIFDNLDSETLGSYCSIVSRITSLRKKYLSALNGHRKNADVLELSKELRLLEASQLNYAGKLGLTPESRVRLAQKLVPPETDPDDDLYGD
ncbi:MAG: P27 family phage terminase small subunit [Clostridia bacterium]|nr:P27 family phage terminase small subunit [Clostridia bacterium]MBP3695217.1 P27 family phage terminase small subunit [Thermoguttaceae bacterium]